MADEPKTASSDLVRSASQTLSQLLARILNQLSLSAWLPSAALTLLVAFIFELGSSLDRSKTTAGDAVAHTFAALGDTSIGGLILLLVVVVVTTMLTQAFSFESIRVMEGYWGTDPRIERVAGWKCSRQRHRYEALTKLYGNLREEAWRQVEKKLEDRQAALAAVNKPVEFTPAMILAVRELVTGAESGVRLSAARRRKVDHYDWKTDAPAEVLRRQLNAEKKLDDYPENEQNMMPTRLGNVLRKYEDDTHSDRVETFVENVYDSLPFSMQLSHDEQRTRLDLYCSMVFVLWLAAAVALVRFGWLHWNYSVGALVLALVGSWVTYGAAIASARYYGLILVAIADYVDTRPESMQSYAATD